MSSSPQTQRHMVLLRGMCHPSKLSEHQNLHPSSHSLFWQPLPPTPAAPRFPPAPRRHSTPGSTGCWSGVWGLSGTGRVPFLPQTSSGARWSPHTPGCDTSPYPLLPRAFICPQDEPGHLGVGDHPSCCLLGEHREASGEKLPVKDGHVSSLCPAWFVFNHKLNKQPRSPRIPLTCKHGAIRTTPCVPGTYLQTRVKRCKRSASDINSQH